MLSGPAAVFHTEYISSDNQCFNLHHAVSVGESVNTCPKDLCSLPAHSEIYTHEQQHFTVKRDDCLCVAYHATTFCIQTAEAMSLMVLRT